MVDGFDGYEMADGEEGTRWVPLTHAQAGWECLRIKGPGDLDEGEARAVGLHVARGYLERYGYAVSDGSPKDCDLLAYKDGTEVMVRVRARAGEEGDPQSVVSEGALMEMRRAALARAMRSDGRLSLRHDALGVVIVSKGRAQVHHFIGVCEWEG